MSLDSGPARRRRVLLFSGIYLVLWLACWYASRLLEGAAIVSLWFLPAGLRFSCLLALGWPGVLLEGVTQSALVLLQITPPPGGPLTEVFSTTTLWRLFYLLGLLAANAAVALPLRRSMRERWDFTRPAHSLRFTAAALTASALAALVGTLGLLALDFIEHAQFLAVFSSWMIGDFIGIITLAPLLLVRTWPRLEYYLQQGRWDRRNEERRTKPSVDRQTLLIVASALLLFALLWQPEITLNFPLIALLLLLPLAVVALRCGQRGSLLAVPLLDGGLALLIALSDLHHQALHYQIVMIAVALLGWWFGGAVEIL